MARREFKGGAAQLTLSSGIAASGVTTINTTGTVTNWPAGPNKFLIVIDKGLATEEKVFCNGRTGNALSVASDADRGADGTAAASHVSGATINHVAGAIDVDEPNDHINTTALDHHTQYMMTDGTRHDLAARHTVTALGVTPAAGSTSSQTTSSAGASQVFSRDDHVHVQPTATPRGVVAFTAHTTDVALTTSDQTLASATFTAVSGRRYRITAAAHVTVDFEHAAIFKIKEGSTVLAQSIIETGVFTTTSGGMIAMAIVAPSAASHTYDMTIVGTPTEGTNGAVVDAQLAPGFILAEDIGST